MQKYEFTKFPDIELIDVDLDSLNDLEKQILFKQAQFSQAMINKDIDTLRELTSSDKTFVHMSGKEQTREEFFNDIRNNHLQYFPIGIKNPIITINDEFASIEFTSILNAVAYGLKGSFQMDTKHYFKNLNGQWINVNEPSK